MSSSSEVTQLRRDLERVTADLARLTVRVSDLEEQREPGFEVVRPSESPSASAKAEAVPKSGYPASVTSQSWGERERIAAEVGGFLRRALEGGPRGTSGRDRIKAASRLYIVARDIQGREYNPPVICNRFSRVKELCFVGSEVGDSVFVGLPSQREVLVCLEAAGLQVPTSFQQ